MIFARRWFDTICFMIAMIALAGGVIMPLLSDEAVAAPVSVVLLVKAGETLPKLSNLDRPPENEGFAGAALAIDDNNTTGRFLGQEFILETISLPADGDVIAAFRGAYDAGFRLFITLLNGDDLLAVSDLAGMDDVLFLNAGALDDRLRGVDCRREILHIAPSRAMLADALGQYLVRKKWRRWFLIVGTRPGDARFAAALRRTAKRFGGKIIVEKEWDFGPDSRRSAQAEVPVFTQGYDYDIILVADEVGFFGEYLAYRSWEPRLVAGTQGLVATPWHWTHEQWGAVQLQNRFRDRFYRSMRARDYTAWAALRSIGEAATRSGTTDPERIRAYMVGDDFELAAFKGQKLTFRSWNGQLRQPILLSADRALVSVSPQQGFLHAKTYLDTLGYDEPETSCDR